MGFSVYILHSATLNKYYVGFTSLSIKERLEYHLSNHQGFTAKAKDWIIIWTKENIEYKKEALELERKIKKRGAKRFLQSID